MTATNRLLARGMAALVILIAGFLPGLAQAQTQLQQIQLTPEAVGRLIESYPVVKTTAEGLQAKYGVSSEGQGDDPAGAWQAWMAYADARSELGRACQQYGFADFESWVATLTSAATALAFAREGGAPDDAMAQAVDAIRNNASISPAQKEMMLKQIEASMGAINTMRPSQENIDAVAPYSDQLERLFESD